MRISDWSSDVCSSDLQAAVWVMQKEGIDQAFGVPGAAINPFYSAMQKQGTIKHILARHVEGAPHMAEGYTRAKPGNIGVALATSERKSVVSGKRVSVRVDLGGRRMLIKTKTKIEQQIM